MGLLLADSLFWIKRTVFFRMCFWALMWCYPILVAKHGVWDVLKADSPAMGSEAVGIPLPHPFGPVGLVCHKALGHFLVAYII